MDQHPSPIARISRELGDSGTKEILPPTERNLTMLSEGNRKLALSMKTGFTTADGYGWWSFHDITLNRLLDAARAEGATSLEAELKRRDEAVEALEPFARLGMATEDTAHLPDELVISLTYDDTEFDADLGGPNTLLGEPFFRAFRRAAAAFAALQPKDPTNAQ